MEREKAQSKTWGKRWDLRSTLRGQGGEAAAIAGFQGPYTTRYMLLPHYPVLFLTHS
jgi:hypothetical protein